MRILCGEIRFLYYLCSRKAKAYIKYVGFCQGRINTLTI